MKKLFRKTIITGTPLSIKGYQLLVLMLFCTFLGVNAQEIPASMKKATNVEGITEYIVPANGLKVLLFPDQSKQTITVNITYLVGSRHEGYGETGMAHLLEHLVFKGTPKHPQIAKELKDNATRYNGTTWLDRTNYYETFNATDQNLEWALDMEADRMINSNIARKDLDTEFSVVRNEFEMRENNPSNVLRERIYSTAFLWHNYGKSTIGNRSDLENVPIDNLKAFYQKYYQPDNAVLIITGKFDDAKTLKLVDKYFAKLPKPTRVLSPTYSVEPTQDGERSVVLNRVGETQVVACGYHIPASSHPDYVACQLLIDLLTDNPSGRLHKALVESNKAVGQYGFTFLNKDPGFAYFNVDVRKEQNLEEAKKLMLSTIDGVSTTPPTDDEVKRVKTLNLKQFEELLRNSESAGTFISEFIGMGDWRLLFLMRDNLEKTTATDVARVAKAYFKPSNRTTGLFVPDAKPDRAEIPQAPKIEDLVDGYKGKAALSEGEVFDPSIPNVEKRTLTGKAGTVAYNFIPKKTRGNTVNATMTLRFGDEKSLQNQSTNAYLAAQMMMKGTKTMTQQQLKDKLDELKASVFIYGSGNSVSAQIETVRDNLPEVMKIVTACLKESTIPEKEFKETVQQLLAQSEQQLTEPDALAQNAMERHLNPFPKSDIRYNSTPQEDIDNLKAVKIDDVRKFYAGFYGGSDATISVVGDFDENAAKKILTEGIGTWKSPKPFTRLPRVVQNVAVKSEVIKTPDKENAFFMAGMNFPMRDDDAEFVSLYIGNYILGSGGLSSRLGDRIRQKEGISYGVGSYVDVDAQDKAATFGAYAIYNPQNAERLEKAFKEEVERILKDGITEAELADAKKSILQNRMVARATDKQLVGKMNSYAYLNRNMKWDTDFESKITNVTVSQINQALKKYVDLKKISMFKAGDFDKVTKP